MVDVDDVAAVTFEKAVVQGEGVLIGIKRLPGFHGAVAGQKEYNVFQLGFHMDNIGKWNPVGGIHTTNKNAFGIIPNPGDQLFQTGKQAVRIDGLEQIIAGFDGVALHGELGGGGEEDDLDSLILLAQFPGGFNTAAQRHHDVQQDDIKGLLFMGGKQRIAVVKQLRGELAGDRGIPMVNYEFDLLQKRGGIITNSNTDHTATTLI